MSKIEIDISKNNFKIDHTHEKSLEHWKQQKGENLLRGEMMGTIIVIILVIAALFGICAFIFSDKGDPKERAADAAGAAAGGAFFAGGCLIQLIIAGLMALAGLWVLGKIFGN